MTEPGWNQGSEGVQTESQYGVGTWDSATLGNHRAVLRVLKPADAVRVHIQWRRRDARPQDIQVIFVDSSSGQRIDNVIRVEVNRESGDFVFEPTGGSGDYYAYFLPFTQTGRRNYPTVEYVKPVDSSDSDWRKRNGLSPGRVRPDLWRALPEAVVVEIQSIDEFSSFFPMEVIATQSDTERLLARFPNEEILIFPEDRSNPIRMMNDLPSRWIRSGPGGEFHGKAAPGEFYAFQIGVFAARKALADLEVEFNGLRRSVGKERVEASALRCFGKEGVDWTGRSFRKTFEVPKGQIRSLWCGILIPQDLPPGDYSGAVTLEPVDGDPKTTAIRLEVSGPPLRDSGDSEPVKHSRLRWLDSTIALDEGIVPPFTPLEIEDGSIRCLGRTVRLDPSGLPGRIESFFAPEVTHLVADARQLLAAPIQLVVERPNGGVSVWKHRGFRFTGRSEGIVRWEAESLSDSLSMETSGSMEFDGCLEFKLRVSALEATQVSDIRLELPVVKSVARYMMGLGAKGGIRPPEYRWKWDRQKNQDSVWIGDVNAGFQVSLRDENYVRPLNTNFYLLQPLNLPPSWHNEGKGGCDLYESGDGALLVKAYSGNRTLQKGESLNFNFRLLVTPFKPLNTDAHFSARYFHRFAPIGEIVERGANVINVHHATEINPYINYPFLRVDQMKQYIDAAHERNLKVKIYYTVRELSNRAPELFALRSLGSEIFSDGLGGGFSWLQEHLEGGYIPGWFVPELLDAAIINTGTSRWHNYYLEGLNWLVKNVGIDGLYIDDVAFDRTVMKRVRKILDRGREGALIDLHSANQFNPRDGFANSANLYLEHFPFLDRLWFGEYFDYSLPPDFWLTEVSGIPFGLMGEMLQDGGNPWRGMVFGMTGRLPWAGNPEPLWRAWDEFGIVGSRMVGFWVPDNPVKTSDPGLLATSYLRPGRVLVALASWSPNPVDCLLQVDWERLGIDGGKAILRAPSIEGFQKAATFAPGEAVPVVPGKGWLLVLDSGP